MACPNLESQGVNRNKEAEIRLNIEMGKLTLVAIKRFKEMFADWSDLKENTKLTLIRDVFKFNKDFMKEHREMLLSDNPKEETVEEEDDMISIDLTSPETEAQRLN